MSTVPVQLTRRNRPHEWVSFDDPDEQRTWVFDVTFLLSPWTCIYGKGCIGVLTGPAPELEEGCCSYGAHLTDEADRERVEAAATLLTAEQWQFLGEASDDATIERNEAGELVTRIVEDACIFLNRPGFPGGPGCALHRAALEAGELPLDWKPDVCWQLPLRREDHSDGGGHVTSTIREWERRDWGGGGAEFHWWCTDAPDAFVGPEPAYRAMADELTALTTPDSYARLADYLNDRTSAPSEHLPHPSADPPTPFGS